MHCDRISDQRAAIEADIHDTIARLHETLNARKTELISQLHQVTQAKLKSLAAQRDQIETIQAQLSSCLLFMRENLMTGNQGEALMMKDTAVRQVKELSHDIPTRHVGAKHRSRHDLLSISRPHCRVSELRESVCVRSTRSFQMLCYRQGSTYSSGRGEDLLLFFKH